MSRRALVVLLLAGCGPPVQPVAPGHQFWSLVKITAGDSVYAFKCLHARQEDSIRIKCFSPVEVPLFDISIDGHAVVTEAASEAVAAKIPFEIGRIGRDVWRVHVAQTAQDIAAFNALNDPDLPEDQVEVVRDASGLIEAKAFTRGGEPVAGVAFSEYEGDHAGRIVLESRDPPYVLEVVQGGTSG